MTVVVQVITALERGGAQRIALETAARLHRAERPQLLWSGPRGPLVDEARERLGRRFAVFPDLKTPVSPIEDLAALVELSRRIERAAAEHGRRVVVHTHSSKAGVLGRLAARSVRGARVVHTVHGFGLDALGPRRRPWLLAAERLAASAADVLVFVSAADRREAERLGLARRARRVVQPGWVDEDRPGRRPPSTAERSAARARLGVPADAPLALTIANLKPQKDPLFHVEVLAAWRQTTSEGRLLFLGDGPLRAQTEARARALGVDDALLLPGFVDDPGAALTAADVMLLASRWEGLPMSVIEGLAAGLPCVVRDGGWAEDLAFAGDQLERFSLQSRPEELARALTRAQGKARAQARLPASFTRAGALAHLDRLYDELLA